MGWDFSQFESKTNDRFYLSGDGIMKILIIYQGCADSVLQIRRGKRDNLWIIIHITRFKTYSVTHH